MLKPDIEAAGDIAAEALAAGGSLIRELHEGIASRPFGTLGVAAAPARMIHDGVSQAVYSGVGGGLRALANGGARLAAQHAPEDGEPALSARPMARWVVGAINGFYGNHLQARQNHLSVQMELWQGARQLRVQPAALAAAFPGASQRVVLFIHGLCGTEATWWLPALGTDRSDRRSYGERLEQELEFTPLYLRYNTGLHISDNGRSLARLIQDVLDAWPTDVRELVLVGHSMGGLVARSACHYAERDDLAWKEVVRHVFCLGTPHLGADLEKGANALSWAFTKLPETRALSTFLNARSVGIKDLRYGSCVEEDWRDCDLDEFLRDRCQEVPFLPRANYYFISTVLRPAPLGRLLGDLLVRTPSSTGRGNGKSRRIPFEVENGHELTGPNHLDLLCHPAVYRQLRSWIERPVPDVAPAAA